VKHKKPLSLQSVPETPKRILMTADTVGGVWTYAIELSRELGEYGVEVALATMGGPVSATRRKEIRHLTNVMVYESNFKLEWMEDPWEDVGRAGEWLLDLESNLGPDLIHLNGYSHASLKWKAPKLVVGHSCVFSWWDAVRKEPVPRDWDRYKNEVTSGISEADMLVAPSMTMLKCLKHHYQKLPHSRVIHNGRDLPSVKSCRAKKPKEKYILTVGRLWDEAKNISSLDCVAQHLPWPIYAAGQNEFRNKAADFKDINFIGLLPTPLLLEWYRSASIFTLPARYEPFGLSALEAGLSGCALVLGDIPSLREIWDSAALFVDPDDPAALKAALLELINDNNLRTRMAAYAGERAAEFSRRRMAEGYLETYRELLNSARTVE
jgi:glycogen synthase